MFRRDRAGSSEYWLRDDAPPAFSRLPELAGYVPPPRPVMEWRKIDDMLLLGALGCLLLGILFRRI